LPHRRVGPPKMNRLWPTIDRGCGPAYEILPISWTRDSFFDALRGMRSQSPGGDGLLLLRMPGRLNTAEIHTAASYAAEAGIENRLCLAYSWFPRDDFGPAVGVAIAEAGLRAVLDDFDGECCFDELLRHPVCALRLSERLTEAAVSDPASASVLDAMIGLATNLGMATLATRASMAARTALAELGVQYIGEHFPTKPKGPESAGSDRTSSRSRYQDALYGP